MGKFVRGHRENGGKPLGIRLGVQRIGSDPTGCYLDAVLTGGWGEFVATLHRLLARTPPGTALRLSVIRRTQRLEITLTTREPP